MSYSYGLLPNPLKPVHIMRLIYVAVFIGGLVGCNPQTPGFATINGRWYTAEQVDLGRSLFSTHCADCPGESAEGTGDWLKSDANGDYPPPPLNGTAHTWHHPLPVMEQTIAAGGIPFRGAMPGFAEVLTGEEARAIISYFQNIDRTTSTPAGRKSTTGKEVTMYQAMQHGNHRAPLEGVRLTVGKGIINRTDRSALGQFKRVMES